MRNLLAVLFGLVMASCFSEDTGGGGGCEDGASGCACYGNNTCDGALLCIDTICRDEDCRDGFEGCACVDGLCLGGLVCEADSCRQP